MSGGVLSSASDDDDGGLSGAIRASDVRAADLQEEPTKRVGGEVTLHQKFHRIRRRRRLLGEHRSERSEQLDTASAASEAIKHCAPDGIRTHAGAGLSRLPLPFGLRGPAIQRPV